jgi:hypothetical protein
MTPGLVNLPKGEVTMKWRGARGVTVALLSLVSLVGFGVSPSTAGTITFSDSFEGSTFNPFWTVVQQNGSVALSSAEAHTGLQSASFASSSGGQRELHLEHTFASQLIGDASIYFYDAAPGEQTLYEQFTLTNSANPSTPFGIGTMDFDASCYAAFVGSQGPNANCGAFPRSSTTNVARTLGWHLLDINVQATGVTLSIDGNPVFVSLGSYTFDGIDILVNGPGFRPNTTAYWDDFNLNAQTVSAVPEPVTILLLGSGLVAGLRRRSAEN